MMAQYNSTLKVRLPKSQLNKLKSGTKNGTEVTWKISSKFSQFHKIGQSG